MEGFLIPPYSIAGYPGCGTYHHGNPKFKYQSWNKKGNLYVPPDAIDYLDFCKRAQLKAILSQVNPGLTPRLRRANTKDFGVQVNPKVDATVQCSLGPKTLFYLEDKRASPAAASPLSSPFLRKPPSTPVNNVRFSRPVAIYSPVFDRRFFPLAAGSTDEEPSDTDAERSGEELRSELEEEARRENRDVLLRRTQKKFNFQFLEQKYGFFHCGKCNIRWESAYVWCISGTSKVYFKQLCRKCQIAYNPYRVESIQCLACGQTRCTCERKVRHIDLKRPHRQDLCGRCKGKRLSCDATYSFKYIV
ncbi:protein ZAR1-like [Denticeps clupeoides]|uniref:protein ZAR1-like n=1 Tax=Denticeps clupeoides TaxID=299321 RepID=UPI0010A2E82D|nr:ZAR1-like protein [Denticeps clupeoides]